MDCSQRCSKDVYECANKLVTLSLASKDSEKSFFKMLMHPVEGRNPKSVNGVQSLIFDSTIEEKNYILKVIKNTLSKILIILLEFYLGTIIKLRHGRI